MGEEEFLGEVVGPAGFDEFEVGVFVGAVDFVTNNGMTGVGEVDADLVHAAGLWQGLDKREWGL